MKEPMSEPSSSRPDYNVVPAAPGTHGIPSHGQDVSLLLTSGGDEETLAACSLWWKHVPAYASESVGVIGHFQCSTCESGSAILDHAANLLLQQGCTITIGPMDGNTWRRYRLVTESTERPPFLMEPENPAYWPAAFEHAGFTPLARYFSAVVTDLHMSDERIPRVEARLSSTGVKIRPVSLINFDQDLRAVHELSTVSFSQNFLYTEVSLEDFLAQYIPLKQYVAPEYVLLAEHGGRIVGFVFAMPDLAQAKRKQPVDTIILKTLAVAPGRTYAGLGAVLLERIHQTAVADGYKQVIHALMHEGNVSMNLSARSATPIRRYTLFAKHLP
jgi:GNAT superfamily N-acetyltransferase